MAQAENIISQIWRVLEKHNIPAPRVAVDSENGSFAIRLSFQSRHDADLITDVVQQSHPDSGADGLVVPHTCDRGH